MEMILNLKPLFAGETEKIPVDMTFEVPAELLEGPSQVALKGEIVGRSLLAELKVNVNFQLNDVCDRGLKSFNQDFQFDFEHTLVEKQESENDELVVLDDFKLDIVALMTDDILLEMPSKHLCSEDCKGLCSVCGKDLNISDHVCEKKEVDPRLSILGQFLDKD